MARSTELLALTRLSLYSPTYPPHGAAWHPSRTSGTKELRNAICPPQVYSVITGFSLRVAVSVLAIGAGLTSSVDGWAVCGNTVETCGDGVDNDCDGVADEGCGCLTTPVKAPFAFSSSRELRRRAGSPGSSVRFLAENAKLVETHWEYGAQMHNRWSLATGPLATSCRLWFPMFEVKPGDRLTVGAWSLTGAIVPLTAKTAWEKAIIKGNWFPTTAKVEATWITGGETTGYRGFIANEIECQCSNPSGEPAWRDVAQNAALDGALLFPKDDVYG